MVKTPKHLARQNKPKISNLVKDSLNICLKATVENPRGSVEKLSPKESVEGTDTVLRGSVRAPKGFSEGKPEASKPRGRSPRGLTYILVVVVVVLIDGWCC